MRLPPKGSKSPRTSQPRAGDGPPRHRRPGRLVELPQIREVADAALEAIGAAVEAHVRQNLSPRGGRQRPLAATHAGALTALWRGFTVERAGRRQGYLAAASARAAYLLYYTVTTAATTRVALRMAADAGWRPRTATVDAPLRVLDLGAASLGASLGVAAYLPDAAIEVVALDSAAGALDDGRAVMATFAGARVGVATARADLRDAMALRRARLGQFDLVVLANLINELPSGRNEEESAAAMLVERVMAEHLAPGGAVLILEPATRVASRGIIALRRVLTERAVVRVLAPCTHEARCPLETTRDWCFFDLPWQRPKIVAACDEVLGHGRTSLKASWLLLTPPLASASSRATRFRIIGGTMQHDGVVRRYLCGGEGRVVAVSALSAAPPWLRPSSRGEPISLDTERARAVGRGGEVEIDVSAPSPQRA